jgi:hypothetical protein
MNNIFEVIISMSMTDILENLNTISQIRPFDKLYHNEHKIYLEDSYIPSVKRWIRGSGRIDTIKFIKYIFTQSCFQMDLLTKRTDSDSVFLHRCLMNSIKNTQNGLLNLQKTYESDNNIYNQIQQLIIIIHKLFS